MRCYASMTYRDFPTSERLSPSMLRVLTAVLTLSQRDGRVTWRGIARQCGVSSSNGIKTAFERLVSLGLISIDRDPADTRRTRSGTIRPRCYMRLYPAAVSRGA